MNKQLLFGSIFFQDRVCREGPGGAAAGFIKLLQIYFDIFSRFTTNESLKSHFKWTLYLQGQRWSDIKS